MRRRVDVSSTTSRNCCCAWASSRRIKRAPKLGYRDSWHLYIYGAENQARFLRHVGVHGARAVAAQEVLLEYRGHVVRNPNVDTVPKEVWAQGPEAFCPPSR